MHITINVYTRQEMETLVAKRTASDPPLAIVSISDPNSNVALLPDAKNLFVKRVAFWPPIDDMRSPTIFNSEIAADIIAFTREMFFGHGITDLAVHCNEATVRSPAVAEGISDYYHYGCEDVEIEIERIRPNMRHEARLMTRTFVHLAREERRAHV